MHRADGRGFDRGVVPLMFVALVCMVNQPECFAKNKIDVNTATYQEIVDGCNLSPYQARSIVEYRDSHGPFFSLEDMVGIRGVGRKAVEKIRADVTVSDNLRCWNCGTVFKELRQHTKGICPACKKSWPATPEQMRKKSAPKDAARQMDGELPIKIGDLKKKVIAVMGEPPKIGRPAMGVINSHQKDSYGLVDFSYRSKGIRISFYRDRVWKIAVESRYKGTLMGIRIGDGEDVIIAKYRGQPRYRGEDRLEYDLLGNRQATFTLGKAKKTVIRIVVCDDRVHDRFSKKAKRLYRRGMGD